MEQKKINMEPGNGTLTADLRIVAPIDHCSLCVAVGTEIIYHGSTFLCVGQVNPIYSLGDGEYIYEPCVGCDAPLSLCHIMTCEAGQRPDGVNVQFKVIARHE